MYSQYEKIGESKKKAAKMGRNKVQPWVQLLPNFNPTNPKPIGFRTHLKPYKTYRSKV